MYDLIYITNVPSFYKINLLNKISETKKIFVIFTGDTASIRNKDFFNGEILFDCAYLSSGIKLRKVFEVIKLLRKNKFEELIIVGWDSIYMWSAAFYPNIRNKSIVVESSLLESKTTGFKGLIKKLFLSRISKAYVSGKSQTDLVVALGFKGKIIKTKGVGIFNIIPQPKYKPAKLVKNFIYVGRLSPEKNLQHLIETFNLLPYLTLNIIGYGPQEQYLKSMAKGNIIFHGAVPNHELYKYYQQNDVFILPSISEPWGLVVEEAFNNGLPVIVSDRVGCAAEIVNASNGIIFKLAEPDGLQNALLKMTDIEFYNSLRYNISQLDFNRIAQEQVNCYLQ